MFFSRELREFQALFEISCVASGCKTCLDPLFNTLIWGNTISFLTLWRCLPICNSNRHRNVTVTSTDDKWGGQ